MRWDDIGDLPCSVARTLSVIGDRWTMLILRDAFRQPVRFEVLRRKFELTRHLLASRLERLVETGIMERRLYQERPRRYEYALTDKGQSLLPILLTMMAWGDRWMNDDVPPLIIRHRTCGHDTHAICACAVCGEMLTGETIETVKNLATHDPAGSPPDHGEA